MTEEISSSNLRRKNESVLPRTAKEFSKYSFWHYTKLSTVESILKTGCFYMNSLAGMNDISERNRHMGTRGTVALLCFSNSDTEKIPMWYLYSGLDGKGAALGFTPGSMMEFISKIETVEVIEGRDKGTVLTAGNDFDLEYGWVYYQDTSDLKRFNYRNKWYSVDNEKQFSNNPENYFVKEYPWEYECEFRIVFRTHLLHPMRKLAVRLPQEIVPKLKLLLAPEIEEKDIDHVIGQYPRIEDNLSINSIQSKLHLNMNILANNKNAIWQYVKDEARNCGLEDKAEEIIRAVNRLN